MSRVTVRIRIDDEFRIFEYDGDLNVPVTTLLEELDEVEYSCSCLQGLCGACAMVINSRPALACKTFLNDVLKDNEIIIEPLSKFPVIKDLKVDKSKIFDDLKECEQWLESKAKIGDELSFEYETSLCLMCGCCVEACPNYDGGDFVGTPIAVSASKLMAQEQDINHLKVLKGKYNDRFYPHCVKSLACEEVCPMGIEAQRAISKMNRKAVWRIWQLLSRD